MRASGLAPPDVRRIVQAQNLLGEPLWRPPAPKGFSDDSAAWLDGWRNGSISPTRSAALPATATRNPTTMVDAALGPLASRETRETVERAASRPQALALLLMAPEFQRR